MNWSWRTCPQQQAELVAALPAHARQHYHVEVLQRCLFGGMQIDVKASHAVCNCSEATVLDVEALELLPTEKGLRRVLAT